MVATISLETAHPRSKRMPADNITLIPSEARGASRYISPGPSARAGLSFSISPPIAVKPGEPPHVISRSGVRLEIHDLAEIASEWKTFEQRADHLAFQSFDW